MNPTVRARLIGAGVLIVAFGAGVGVGRYLPQPEADGIRVMVKSSDQMPQELEALGLTASQRAAVHPILQRGTARIDSVMKTLFPQIDAVIGVTDSEIRAVLTPGQRVALDQVRKDHPQRIIREKRVVDTIRKP